MGNSDHNHLGCVVHAERLWFLCLVRLSGRFWMIGVEIPERVSRTLGSAVLCMGCCVVLKDWMGMNFCVGEKGGVNEEEKYVMKTKP